MIGLDLSDKSIKMVRLSNDGRRKLLSSCWQEIPTGAIEHGVVIDKAKASKALLAAMNQCSVKPGMDDVVVASIPETESFLRVLEIPKMEEDEVAEAVRWEVAQHIPFGIENVFIDWQTVKGGSPKAGRIEVLVGAAEKKVIDPLYSLLTGLNLDIAALELESQSIVRSLISNELKEHEGLLVVDLGAVTTNIVIHDRGAIRFTASLRKGVETLVAPLPEEIKKEFLVPPGQIKRDPKAPIPAQLTQGLDELMTEIHGIVEFYTKLDPTNQVRELILTGGGANLAGLEQAFLRFFDNLHAERGNPWVNIVSDSKEHVAPMKLEEAVHFSTALGCALRPVIGGYEKRN